MFFKSSKVSTSYLAPISPTLCKAVPVRVEAKLFVKKFHVFWSGFPVFLSNIPNDSGENSAFPKAANFKLLDNFLKSIPDCLE